MEKIVIKVCGMREPKNIKDVESLDVDFLGFIFFSGSTRYIGCGVEALESIRNCTKTKVGVFVNEKFDDIIAMAESYRLDCLQLHGNETTDLCKDLQQRGYSVIKAFSIGTADDFKIAENYSGCCDYFLFDTKCAGYGGSGKRFDWSLLAEYKGQTFFLLSGGLTPDCAGDINRLNHQMFAGIDLNSGFEISPAKKDIDKLRNFINHVRKSDIKKQLL